MFYVGAVLDLITLLPKHGEKSCIGKGLPDDCIYVLTDQTPNGCFPLFLGLPLSVAFSAAFRLDDGQTVFPAECVRDSPNIAVICLEIISVFFSVDIRNGIEEHMIMNVGMVKMGGYHCLVPIL